MEFSYVKVLVEGNKLTMTFLGNENIDKEDFIGEISEYLFLYWFECRMHIIFVLIREMVKNIFDHGTGKGVLTLIKNGETYEFEFIDHNPQMVIFEEIIKINKGNGWVKKSSTNCGVGLSIIKTIGKEKEVTLIIDDTKGGINYSGSYHP